MIHQRYGSQPIQLYDHFIVSNVVCIKKHVNVKYIRYDLCLPLNFYPYLDVSRVFSRRIWAFWAQPTLLSKDYSFLLGQEQLHAKTYNSYLRPFQLNVQFPVQKFENFDAGTLFIFIIHYCYAYQWEELQVRLLRHKKIERRYAERSYDL